MMHPHIMKLGGGGSLAHPKIMGTNDPSEAIACHRVQCLILPFFS